MLAVLAALMGMPDAAQAQEFPFGLEVTLDVPHMAGARRRPTIEVGDNGEAKLDLWCKTGRGQFSVAGDTVIFMPGQLTANACTPQLAQADDALLANLANVANWKRQGDTVLLIGQSTLRFHVNTN